MMQIYSGTVLQAKALEKTLDRSETKNSQQMPEGIQNSFHSVLQNKISEAQPLHFSRHANTRLSAREINLSSEQMKRVESAVDLAREKGIKESLVLVDDVALVVNVKSKLVVTAMQANDNVFTNIDGAVIV